MGVGRICWRSHKHLTWVSLGGTTHNETLPIAAMRVQIVGPQESIAETQPQLHPALLRLSAIISQYFMRDRLLPFLLDKSGKLSSVDLPKRGNCYPFFGGTENSLSHVVAAQLIVELVSLIEMNTILILSLVILLFGFDSSSRNESIRFQRRVD